MFVYRIVKLKKRTTDLSGTGAFNEGGRWNSPGVFALYTSEHEALAMLELLVHLDESELPADMFVMKIEVYDNAPVLVIPESDLPADWRLPNNLQLKNMGDKIFTERQFIAIKIPSAVMPNSFNYIFNPLFSGYHQLLTIANVTELPVDKRLRK